MEAHLQAEIFRDKVVVDNLITMLGNKAGRQEGEQSILEKSRTDSLNAKRKIIIRIRGYKITSQCSQHNTSAATHRTGLELGPPKTIDL